MKKRTFLKTSSALVTGSLLSPLASCAPEEKAPIENMARTNWAGNYTYQAANFHEPTGIEAIQQMVKANPKMRVLGTRHCFNDIADSRTNQISVRALDKVVDLNEAAQTVTVEAGISYGRLCPWLHEQGYALHNLASLPHISIAGACATATHGSGMQNGNLATAVEAIEFIDAAGNIRTLSRENDGDKFAGAIVHLGALGVLTKLTLSVQPAFQVVQHVYQDLPVSAVESSFSNIMSAGYSVSLFTDWQTDNVNQLWIKSREGQPAEGVGAPDFYGARLFDRKVHPILDHPAESCTEQQGEAGPWYERLPHFKMEFTPSSGKELQSEFFVPLPHALSAFHAIASLKDQIGPVLFISEIRAVAADDLWMSPCYQQPCMAFHFTWKPDTENVQKLLPELESRLQAFSARPHWGKVYTTPKRVLQGLYPKLPDFQALVREYDPDGKFVNKYLEDHLWG